MNNKFYESIINPLLKFLEPNNHKHSFCIEDNFYSYSKLCYIVNDIRYAIRKSNSNKQSFGLVINNDIETYASILALWFEGKSYVPLHPAWPFDRCSKIINQVELDTVLDSSESTRYNNIHIINTKKLLSTDVLFDIRTDISDDELAYILFTSGSTGEPKGVQISRGNLANFIIDFNKTGIKYSDSDKHLQCFDLSFDVSVQCFLTPLLSGASIYTVSYDQVKFIYSAGLIDEYHLTSITCAPSMIQYMLPYLQDVDLSSLRLCIVTAEASQIKLISQFKELCPKCDIYNFYGPTECTIYSAYYKLPSNSKINAHNDIISIGKCFDSINSIIIDEHNNIVHAGEKGELCLSGPQVSKGYLNNIIKNQSSFFSFTINGHTSRFYHTGDLCYLDLDTGNIMYCGRIDFQTKIQGYRVELGEIEFHACHFMKGARTVCIPYEVELNVSKLALFVESNCNDSERLLEYLNTQMPSYMIPSKVIFIKNLPVNNNGKIDRKQLKNLI